MDDITEIFDGRWVTDSRTGRQYLIDLKTNRVIMTKNITGQAVICEKLIPEESNDHSI